MPTRRGDIVALGSAMWAVVEASEDSVRLLRLNDTAAGRKADSPRPCNVLGVDQAAEELGLSPKTVREHLRTGQLKGHKTGTVWRILRSENPVLAAS